MIDHEWPTSVRTLRGMAPGELRLVSKVTGGARMEELDAPDQVKVQVFIALFRMFRDDPPEVLWEQAEWIAVEPDLEGAGGAGPSPFPAPRAE